VHRKEKRLSGEQMCQELDDKMPAKAWEEETDPAHLRQLSKERIAALEAGCGFPGSGPRASWKWPR